MRRALRRLFGSAALAHDRARDVWIPPAIQDITRDVRFAVRLLVKDPSDPATLVSITLLLALAAIAATVMPARRALRVDPASRCGASEN